MYTFCWLYEQNQGRLLCWGSLHGPVAKKPPCNAGDMGSSGRGTEIPPAVGQLSPAATTTEPVL